MRRLLIAAILSLLSVLPAYAIHTPMQQARQVVVIIISGNPDVESSCSAVVISPNVALTAAHCMVIPEPVLRREGSEGRPVVSYSTYPDKDVAVLVVPGIGCPCATQAPTAAEIDEVAYAIGYPLGIGNVLTVGHIQGRVVNPAENVEYLVATCSVAPGNSGGGLFVVRDNKAYLVGIVVATTIYGMPTFAVELWTL